MDITTIKSKYHQHHDFFCETLEKFKVQKTPIEFPIAHKILLDFSERIDNIFNSILLSAKNDNLYSCFILYRSILEHFYKAFYITDRTVTEKNDETAEKFEKHYFISEFLAEQAGVLEMDDLINNAESKTDFIKFLVTKIPGLEGYDKENQKEISTAIKQFSLKEILKYLHSKFSVDDKGSKLAPVYAQTIPEYSHICTFIHGGPYASKLMEKFKEQNSIDHELTKIVNLGINIVGLIKENVFLTFRLNSDFIQTIDKFHRLRTL